MAHFAPRFTHTMRLQFCAFAHSGKELRKSELAVLRGPSELRNVEGVTHKTERDTTPQILDPSKEDQVACMHCSKCCFHSENLAGFVSVTISYILRHRVLMLSLSENPTLYRHAVCWKVHPGDNLFHTRCSSPICESSIFAGAQGCSVETQAQEINP